MQPALYLLSKENRSTSLSTLSHYRTFGLEPSLPQYFQHSADMLPALVKTGAPKGCFSRPLKQSSHNSDKPHKKTGPEPAWVRPKASRGHSEKQKESSKGTIERAFDSLKVPVVPGRNGRMQCVNYKARGQGDPRRGDTSSESDPYFYTDSSGDSDNGSARGAHQNGGERGQSRDTVSVASGQSNKSTESKHSVNNGNGSTTSLHPGPGSVHQDIDGGAQPLGDTASVASGKSHKSTKSKHSVHSGKSNKSTRSTKSEHSMHTGSVRQDGGAGGNAGTEGQGGEEDHGTEKQGRESAAGEGAAANDNSVEGVAGADANGGEDDAAQAATAQGAAETNNPKEGDASKHAEKEADVAEDHVEESHGDEGRGEEGHIKGRTAGQGQGASDVIEEGDGDGHGEKHTRHIMVI